MGKECVVFGCTNRDTDKQLGLKFHRIPKNEPRRALWLNAIRRQDPASGKDWAPGDEGARVCSDHFIEGKSDDSNSHDYIPSVNLGYQTPLRQLDRYNRANKRSTQKAAKRQLEFQSCNREEAAVALLDLLEFQPQIEEKENKVSSNSHETCVKLLAEASVREKNLLRELERMQMENKELKSAKASLRAENCSEEEVEFYTGLPSMSCFQWLVLFMKDDIPNSSLLHNEDIVLMTFMKLRLNLTHRDLGFRFGVSLPTVTNYIETMIPKLAEKLRFFIRWPERDDVLRSRPQCFKETYPKCVSIIDCTEVFIQCPGNFSARAATYSNYKHTNTVKYLVSITPAGSVSFVSKAFGGKASDKVITLESGFLNLLHHGDQVMADRGFLIREELASCGAELIMPAFTKGKPQLSANEVENSRKISNVRIHVERAMERLKNFRVLSDRMPMNMVPHADSIMTICAAVVNLHPCLVN